MTPPVAVGELFEAEGRERDNSRWPSTSGGFAQPEPLHVPDDRVPHEGSSPTWRRSVLDLRAARDVKGYDKTGGAILVRAVRAIIFPGRARLTREMCESFFDDDENFDL